MDYLFWSFWSMKSYRPLSKKTLQAIEIALGYPSEHDSKNLVLKIAPT